MRREQEASNEDLLADDQAHSAALEEAVERALAGAVREKPRLLPPEVCRDFVYELCRRGPEARRRWLRQCRWAARPEVVRTLLAESRAANGHDAARAEHLARLALELAQALGRQPSPRLVTDLKAEALGLMANSFRAQERYDEAEECWREVDGLRRQGSGDGLLSARLSQYRCAFLRDRRQLTEAKSAGRKSVAALRMLGHEDDAFLASLTYASVLYAAGEFEEALTMLADLRSKRVGKTIRSLFRLHVQHNVIFLLTELGLIPPAQRLLLKAEPLYLTEATPDQLLQRTWLQGKILAGQRAFREAAATFARLRQDYLARQRPFDAALVGLDEMLCLAEVGRFTEVCDLAGEVLAVFERLELPAETAQALDTLMLAARRLRPDLEQVRRVHGLLQPFRRLPPRG